VKRAPFSTIAALLAFGLGASPAHANRFWVSGHGTDSGACGPVSAPCLSFQRAHDNAAAGDEIDVLDPGDYGTVVITKAISIINDGVGTAGVQVGSGNAVTINAGPGDAVHLRGLDIDGLGTADNGIVFNSGAGLAVVNCVVRHFHFNGSFTTGNGVLIQPTSGTTSFLVENTIAADNGNIGVHYFPQSGNANANGAIDRVTATSNGAGIGLDTFQATGGTINATISNSVTSNNLYGLYVDNGSGGATLIVTIDQVYANNNGIYGINALNSAQFIMGRSVLTSNGTAGINNATSPSRFYTYGNNQINFNGSQDIQGGPLVPRGTQ